MYDRQADQIRHDIQRARARLSDMFASSDRMKTLIRDNPIGIALGSVAVGFLMGLLLPRTSLEADRIREVKRMAKDAGVQVVEASKQIVRDTMYTTFGSTRRSENGGL
jgi:Pyruvate/2-oxoacid:ferredoxin oxidoreductase gamma subunit